MMKKFPGKVDMECLFTLCCEKNPHTYNLLFFSLIKISMQKITIFLVHFCPPISLIEWVNHYFFKAAVNEIRKKFLKKCFCFLKNPKSCCTYENIPMLKYFSLKWLFQYYQKKKNLEWKYPIVFCPLLPVHRFLGCFGS